MNYKQQLRGSNIHSVALHLADSWSNWNLEMLILPRGENGVPREKPLKAKERTNNKLDLQEVTIPGFEPIVHIGER